ncbi:MAG: hypothetical protein IAF38_00120 [Bacteroidia bacterium]|nr:hypothetical protein [Bacteroidia bacterium]
MLSQGSLIKSTKASLLLSLLFVAGLFLPGQAQEFKPNAIVDYGDHHPYVFIVAIFVAVIVLVWLVYYFFKKAEKKKELQKEAFSKPSNIQRGRSHPADRRSAAKRNMPQTGGFTRK